MKLPSGREIPNSELADVIEGVVLDAMQHESFSNAWNYLPNDLMEGVWSESAYSEEDALAIAKEIRETAGQYWLKMTERFGELHEELVHSKYPHEG